MPKVKKKVNRQPTILQLFSRQRMDTPARHTTPANITLHQSSNSAQQTPMETSEFIVIEDSCETSDPVRHNQGDKNDEDTNDGDTSDTDQASDTQLHQSGAGGTCQSHDMEKNIHTTTVQPQMMPGDTTPGEEAAQSPAEDCVKNGETGMAQTRESNPTEECQIKETGQSTEQSTANDSDDQDDAVLYSIAKVFDSQEDLFASSPDTEPVNESSQETEMTEPNVDDSAPSPEDTIEETWKGTALGDLPSLSEACLPTMSQSPAHTVCFDLKTFKPDPPELEDLWDTKHIKLPCSKLNVYPTLNESLGSRWVVIGQALERKIQSVDELQASILEYNGKYMDEWDFTSLRYYLEVECSHEESNYFFTDLLPRIQQLAIGLPHVCTKPIPLLKSGSYKSVSMTQHQAACLLANAFFCTFPRRNAAGPRSEYSNYPDINWNRLFEEYKGEADPRRIEKLRCLMHYFDRVTKKMPEGSLTYTRQVIKDFPDWRKSSTLFTKLHATSEGTIEDQGEGLLQVDFANRRIGGGALSHGCVQEEIRFVLNPELIISRLFTERLEDNETLIITGAERFSSYSGYCDTFEWTSDYQDKCPRDSLGRRLAQIVAMDASVYKSRASSVAQFDEDNVIREINKAYCGFASLSNNTDQLAAVATGNWGCGAFGGDHRLKALIQMIAAAEAKRDICYFTFNDKSLCRDIFHMHKCLVDNKVTVGDAMNIIKHFHAITVQTTAGKRKPQIKNLAHFVLEKCRRLQRSNSPDYAALTP